MFLKMFPGYPKDFNAEGALRGYSRNIAFPAEEWLNENFIKNYHEEGSRITELENRVKKPSYALWRDKTELSQTVMS